MRQPGLLVTALLLAPLTAQVDWTEVGITARQDHAMAHDLRRGRTVVFGGHGCSGWMADTIEWDGTVWTPYEPALAPSPRSGHAMAYDLARGVVVLFGGHDGVASLADTWEWNGAAWNPRQPAVSPPASSGHAMAHDLVRGVTVMVASNTWEWDGAR